MLAAAISARRTACPPHHLGDQAFKIASHAQIMSVSAMIGHDIVVGTQISGENDRQQFLADTSVNRPVELASCKQLKQLCLRATDLEGVVNKRIERQAVEAAVRRKARRHCTIQPLHVRQNGGLLPAFPVHADGCSCGIVRSQERLFLSSVTLRSLRGHYHPPPNTYPKSSTLDERNEVMHAFAMRSMKRLTRSSEQLHCSAQRATGAQSHELASYR